MRKIAGILFGLLPAVALAALHLIRVTDGKMTVTSGRIQFGASGPVASGGTMTTNAGYIIHSFTDVGETNFVVSGSGALTCEVLVVAGGGGACPSHGSAGGAGGVVWHSNYVASGSNTVTVGAGGIGAIHYTRPGNGSNSVFGAITAIGGGAGGAHSPSLKNGMEGGSGGGGAEYAGRGAAGKGLQGNSGGGIGYGNDGSSVGTNTMAEGGGGAGAAGLGPQGGIGVEFSQFAPHGSPAGWFGGGGSGYESVAGGKGGGGNGTAAEGSASDGVKNTGGGAGSKNNYPGTGGSGGSGIVIVRYKVPGT